MEKSTNVGPSHPVSCSHRPPCPGCPRFGADGIGAHASATLAALAADTGAHLAPVAHGAPWRFRWRARLMVRGRSASPKIGIFQRGSHRIVDIPRCVVHHPHVDDVAAAVKRAMRALGIAPYADRPHRGLVRALQVAVERATERVQIVLVANDTSPDALTALAERIAHDVGDRLHGLWWNGNPERTNVVLGPRWHRWTGEAALVERLGGADVFFHPGAFGQANATVLDVLVSAVQDAVPGDARVLECYAGAGTFGLGLLARSRHVTFNEANPHGLWSLARGIEARPAPERARASVAAGPAAEHAALVASADVVIADPPRRGLDAAVRDALVRAAPRRVILVGCDVDTFDRDVRALVRGGFRLRAVTPIDAFRFTEQIESVAVLDGR